MLRAVLRLSPHHTSRAKQALRVPFIDSAQRNEMHSILLTGQACHLDEKNLNEARTQWMERKRQRGALSSLEEGYIPLSGVTAIWVICSLWSHPDLHRLCTIATLDGVDGTS